MALLERLEKIALDNGYQSFICFELMDKVDNLDYSEQLLRLMKPQENIEKHVEEGKDHN